MSRTIPSAHILILNCVAFPALALAAGAPVAAAPHLPVPHESFLNYHVSTVNELSQEITLDPQVRERLAKHFHLTNAQLVSYIHRNLILRHLDKTGTYRVACVRPDGSEYWIQSRLSAGTPVFASRVTGQPILKLACGNPMVSALPPTLFPNKPLPPAQLAATPVMVADANLDAAPVLTAIDGTQSTLLIPDDATDPPVVRVSPSLQALGGGSSFSSIFPALLGAGGAVAVFGHGGSSPNSSGGTPNIPAVPEASTLVSFSLLLGGGILILLRRKATAKQV